MGVAGPQWGFHKNRQKVFSSAHINMKWLLMSRNRGVHETSVSCLALTRDKYKSWMGGPSGVYCSWRPHTYYIFFSVGGQKLLICGPQMAHGPLV